MKGQRWLSVFVFISSINIGSAQFAENHALYTTDEVHVGNYFGYDVNLNYVYKEKYSVKIGLTSLIRKPKTQPENYSSGIDGIFSFGLSNPYDMVLNYHLALGKMYRLNKNGMIRANLSIGIAYTIIREPENWKRNNNILFFENYSWNYRDDYALSLIINPKIEFPILRFYGISISPMLQVNKYRTYIGIGFGQMIGLLRKKID